MIFTSILCLNTWRSNSQLFRSEFHLRFLRNSFSEMNSDRILMISRLVAKYQHSQSLKAADSWILVGTADDYAYYRNSRKQIALPSLSWINKVEHDFHVDFMFEHMAIEFTTSVPKTRVPTQNILWYLETNLPQWPKFPNFHLQITAFFSRMLAIKSWSN